MWAYIVEILWDESFLGQRKHPLSFCGSRDYKLGGSWVHINPDHRISMETESADTYRELSPPHSYPISFIHTPDPVFIPLFFSSPLPIFPYFTPCFTSLNLHSPGFLQLIVVGVALQMSEVGTLLSFFLVRFGLPYFPACAALFPALWRSFHPLSPYIALC